MILIAITTQRSGDEVKKKCFLDRPETMRVKWWMGRLGLGRVMFHWTEVNNQELKDMISKKD